jgi:small subunit ribosomal protein S20
MATHESSKKRARQDVKRNALNRSNMSTMRTAITKVKEAIANKDLQNIDELMRQAQSVIAKTRRKGCLHVNNMARRIGRLTKSVTKAKVAPTVDTTAKAPVKAKAKPAAKAKNAAKAKTPAKK